MRKYNAMRCNVSLQATMLNGQAIKRSHACSTNATKCKATQPCKRQCKTDRPTIEPESEAQEPSNATQREHVSHKAERTGQQSRERQHPHVQRNTIPHNRATHKAKRRTPNASQHNNPAQRPRPGHTGRRVTRGTRKSEHPAQGQAEARVKTGLTRKTKSTSWAPS